MLNQNIIEASQIAAKKEQEREEAKNQILEMGFDLALSDRSITRARIAFVSGEESDKKCKRAVSLQRLFELRIVEEAQPKERKGSSLWMKRAKALDAILDWENAAEYICGSSKRAQTITGVLLTFQELISVFNKIDSDLGMSEDSNHWIGLTEKSQRIDFSDTSPNGRSIRTTIAASNLKRAPFLFVDDVPKNKRGSYSAYCVFGCGNLLSYPTIDINGNETASKGLAKGGIQGRVYAHKGIAKMDRGIVFRRISSAAIVAGFAQDHGMKIDGLSSSDQIMADQTEMKGESSVNPNVLNED